MSCSWRQMKLSDLDAVDRIADEVHTLYERPEVFKEKFNLYPEGCFVLENDEEILGYCISHPWNLHEIPMLDRFITSLPFERNCLYIHDIVVLPSARGKSHSLRIMEWLETMAYLSKFLGLALVSVYGTSYLWEKYGFVQADASDVKLKFYGDDAKYMVKTL
jgi:GNAT superfamily N-acetyltransferase